MFTDNDELSVLIASMMDVQKLIILSNIDGIFNGPPSDPSSSVIRLINRGCNIDDYLQTTKSSFGRGGMVTKTNIARKVADEGVEVVIANGKTPNILISLVDSFDDTLCTRFVADINPVSSVKKWIAHSDGFAKGVIHINECAAQVLLSDKAVSLLPIGITNVNGQFEKDDIVRIVDHNENCIGVGKVNCSSKQVVESMGKHGRKAVVHYDYLYIE